MTTDRVEILRAVCAAFDRHDLDAILEHFAEDAVFESPRGSEPWGQRFEGKAAIREAFAARFSGIPDVRYTDDSHFVGGDQGVSRWTISGTVNGSRMEVHGCDIWTFRGDQLVEKDSYWKIRT
jgi:ketosteroid isomerase-like protein